MHFQDRIHQRYRHLDAILMTILQKLLEIVLALSGADPVIRSGFTQDTEACLSHNRGYLSYFPQHSTARSAIHLFQILSDAMIA
jgi:hypothetical protein